MTDTMLRSRFFFAAFFALSPLPVLADSWDSLASISAEPTARYVCYGNADGKNITCDSTAPYVDATGNVGIGTASPSAMLHVLKTTEQLRLGYNGTNYASFTTDSTGNLTIANTNTGAANPANVIIQPSGNSFSSVILKTNTGNEVARSYGSGNARFMVGGISYDDGSRLQVIGNGSDIANFFSISVTSSLIIKSTGNVGIGTNNPSTALSFGGDAARTVGMERGTVAATAGYALTLQAGGATSGSTDKNGGDLVLSSGTATGTGTSKITFKTHPAGSTGTVDTTATTAMTILGSGKVGIGSASPSQALDVNGNIGFVYGINKIVWPAGAYIIADDGAGSFNLYTGAYNFNLSTYSGSSIVTRLFIDKTTGNVGIGTTTVNHKLDVNGNIGLAASSYVNWAATDGSTGYGLRDNAGTLEYKNSGGAWSALGGVATNFAAGTAAAPGLYVTGDSDTGFYQATANTLSITAGGVEAARFNTAASGVNYLSVTPSATGAAVQLAPAGSDTNIGLTIAPKGTGALTFTSGATTGDGVTLNANSLTTGNGMNLVSTSTAGGASGASYLLKLARSGANASTAHTAYGVYSTVTNTNATSGTNIAGYFSASGATTANYGLIVAAGNVGIGTANPGYRLQISGVQNDNDLVIRNTSTGGLLRLQINDTVAALWTGSNHPLYFGTNGVYNRIAVDTSGNLGIGTTTPASKLDVSGDMKLAGTGSETCATAADIGKMRINPATGRLQICRW